MNGLVNKLVNRHKCSSNIRVVAEASIVLMVIRFVSVSISYLLAIPGVEVDIFKSDQNPFIKGFESALIVPLFETLIFQLLPIAIGLKFTKKNTVLIWISALLFSVAHVYPNWLGGILMIPVGFVFAGIFLGTWKKINLPKLWSIEVRRDFNGPFF